MESSLRPLPEPFALRRYFSWASLLCTLGVALILGWSYQYLALRDLVHLGEDRNVALTRALANALWPRFAGLVALDAEAPAERLLQRAALERIDEQVAAHLAGTEAVKLKVYALNGRTVYSSDPTQTGEDKSDNPAFRAAIAGQVTSGLAHRDSLDAFEGVRTDLDVISTYLPMRDAAQQVVAVFEIYSDVSDLTGQLRQTRWLVFAVVLGLLASLYALLWLLVARAQRVIDSQDAELRASIHELDERVRDRTRSLDARNAELRREIEERRQIEQVLRESTARFHAITHSANDAIVTADSAGAIVGWNRQAEVFFGYGETEALGRPLTLIIPERHRALHEQGMSRRLASGDSRVVGHTFETEGLRKDGSEFPIELSLAQWRVGDRQFVSGTIRDVSERRRSEHHLRVAATTFEAQEGVTITDAQKNILRVNRAFTEITGYAADEVVGRKPRLLSSGRHDAAFYAAMWDSIERTGSWQGEIWNRRKDGEIYPEWLNITAVRGPDGEVTNYVGTFADITERKSAEQEIAQLAFYDQLTGLPNRRLLLDRLRHALAGAARSGRAGAVLFLDLDNFKTLNDSAGHDVGDELLREAARRLTGCVRESDTVARLGGDEFVVVLEELDGHDTAHAAMQTEHLAEKIQLALNAPFELGGTEAAEAAPRWRHHCSCSIGIALFGALAVSAEELMKRADTAMYQAKAAGRNALRFFDPAMQASVNARAALESDLRRAIDLGQFELFYQPQVDAAGGLQGAEALLRWWHPERGLVGPSEFIGLAEETGLIHRLGAWVMESAFRQQARWSAHPALAHLQLAVNVSALQFRHVDFVALIRDLLRRTGAEPRRIKLELTESLMVREVADTIEKMEALRELGFSFVLDDFGTGYSSLAYLKSMPLDQLKIDQSFVRDVLTDANDAAISRTVLALGHSLGLGVVAEGVETPAQHRFLAAAGCSIYQGYYFGRPLPAAEFIRLAVT